MTLQDLDEVLELLERQEEEEPEVEEEQEAENVFVDTTHGTCLMETFYKSWVIKTKIILCMDSFVFVCVCLSVCLQSSWTMRLQEQYLKIEAHYPTWTPLLNSPLTTFTM